MTSKELSIETGRSPLHSWKRRIMYVAAAALLIKMFLAWFSPGTQDVGTWEKFARDLREVGGIGVYYKPYTPYSFFNHPPFILHFLHTLNWLCDVTGLSLRFCLRAVASLADTGTAFVLWQILQLRLKRTFENQTAKTSSHLSPLTLLLYVGAPSMIWISGFHGNTDSIMIFFVVLSLLLMERGQPVWMVGVAFGMSLNIKVASLIYIPVFLLYLKEPRKQFQYSIAVAATFFCGGLPYLVQDPIFIFHQVFGYGGRYGTWGVSLLLNALETLTWLTEMDSFFSQYGKFLLVTSLIVCSLWMNYLPRKPDLLRQCGVITLVFFAVTPSFGSQYMAWLAPLMLVLGESATAFFYISSAMYLSIYYGLTWRSTLSNLPSPVLSSSVLDFSAVLL